MERVNEESATASSNAYMMEKESKIENSKILFSVNEDLQKTQELSQIILKLFSKSRQIDEEKSRLIEKNRKDDFFILNNHTKSTDRIIESLRYEISEVESQRDKLEKEYKTQVNIMKVENEELKNTLQASDMKLQDMIQASEEQQENDRIKSLDRRNLIDKLLRAASQKQEETNDKSENNGNWINAVVVLMSALFAQSNVTVRNYIKSNYL